MRIEPRPALRVASPGTITTPRIDAENETRN
ncbi:MAG: hypothetical protein QOF76_515, partial [Solirubrobacteraceae bacterium]|nr:hypothetical protein [Solirubrobacteraceae bacterium]